MAVPSFLQSTLWSSDVHTLEAKRDKIYIITQILNHGTGKQLKWLLAQYPLRDIRSILAHPCRGAWHEDVLNYWETILDYRIPENVRRRALFSLTPISRV